MNRPYIIIAAYRAHEYIAECLDSIPKDVPILLGIDGCEQTLETVKDIRHRYPNMQVFWYPENLGTYITFNSLLQHVPEDAAFLTFGAKDIMFPDMVDRMMSNRPCKSVNDDVICIDKKLLDKVGGFREWRMASDSDFLMRLSRIGVYLTSLPYLFHHRQFDGKIAPLPVPPQDGTDVKITPVLHQEGIELFRVTGGDTTPKKPWIQAVVSASLDSFRESLFSIYGLSDYTDSARALVMFGMYRPEDYMILKMNTGPVTVVWFGSDSMQITPERLAVLQSKKIDHVAISHHVSNDLTAHGIAHRVVPVSAAQRIANPLPLGDAIYCYGADFQNGTFYGEHLCNEIEQRTGIKVIRATLNTYSPEELKEIYAQCFIGLRLTAHDGMPTTVTELGLMGRKSIYNGPIPHVIAWENVDDICASIVKEYKNRKKAKVDKIAVDWLQFINIGTGWIFPEEAQDNGSVQKLGRKQEIQLRVLNDLDDTVLSRISKELKGLTTSDNAFLKVVKIMAEFPEIFPPREALPKTEFHGWYQHAFDAARAENADVAIFLTTGDNWDSAKLLDLLDKMPKEGPWCINPINCGNDSNWFGIPSQSVDWSKDIRKVCFTSDAFILNREALQALDYTMPEVPALWHRPEEEGRSSGIGHYLSMKLNALKVPIYRPEKSAVIE